jgi:polyhydroxyalkanoate synthesis regulator protein
VLTQIIVEQEQKGQNLLPISFLRQLIGFYGDSMQFLVPGYLEQSMIAFARNQEQMRKNLQATFGIFPLGQFEEVGKQNIALFERALKMLAPLGGRARRLRIQSKGDRRRGSPPLAAGAQIDAADAPTEELGRDRQSR